MAKHFNLKIFGRVQGVSFRYFVKKQADDLGVCGFVRNLTDGSVYIEAEGSEENLNKFRQFCEKGNAWSKVRDVNFEEAGIKNFTDFDILVE